MEEDNIQLPEEYRNAPREVITLVLEKMKLRKEMSDHPWYWYTVENQITGQKLSVKAATPPGKAKQIVASVLEGCGDPSYKEEVGKELKKRWEFFQKNYTTKLSNLTRKINTEFAEFSNDNMLDRRKQELLEMFGAYKTPEEVHKIVSGEWAYGGFSLNAIRKWYKDHEQVIERKRMAYVKNREFRVGTEAGRLEALNEQLIHWQGVFSSKPKIEVSNMILRVLEQGRREVKGEELKLTVDGKIDINATLQGKQNIIESSQKLAVNMMIIGMVAAQTGKDPMRIMHSLATSYYARNNGFNGNITGKEVIESPVNLIKSYDWEELGRKNRAIEEADRGAVQDADIVDNEEDIEKKKKLMSFLKKSINND